MARLFQIAERLDVETVLSDPMRHAITEWMALYTGDAPWLLSGEVVSLQLPAFIATEVARLATVEMCSTVDGSARADYLNEVYQHVIDDARTFTEYAAAGGGLILKPYVVGTEIRVAYVKAGDFIPTAVTASGVMTGCLFLDTLTRGETVYTRVEQHTLETGRYRITNHAFESRLTDAGGDILGRPIALGTVPEWADILPETTLEGVDRPLFGVLRMPYANAVEPGSPLGVSCFARAVDLIREADKQFSRILWEMESGERALYVDTRATNRDGVRLGELPVKRLYRMLDADPVTQGELFHEWSPSLRIQEQSEALNEILQKIEDACGLSRGTVSRAPESGAGGAKTATELRIMRQRTYALIRDTQKAVETALRQLLYAMDTWATIAELAAVGDYDVSFEFDDSIVTDRAAEFVERMQLVSLGAMEPWELRAWYLGETEETARQHAGRGAAPLYPEV